MTVDKLPPCAQWADPNGNSINAQDAANRINAANKLLASPKDKQDGNVKCATVITAIGPMDTNPAKFVQRIFSMVLGLAGGIALILIIIVLKCLCIGWNLILFLFQ